MVNVPHIRYTICLMQTNSRLKTISFVKWKMYERLCFIHKGLMMELMVQMCVERKFHLEQLSLLLEIHFLQEEVSTNQSYLKGSQL